MLHMLVFILLTFAIIFAAGGNSMICVMILLRKKLQHPGNYLLLSLALSDCFVAYFAMPPALLVADSGLWTGGVITCHMWIFMDVFSCASSILNLCMICIDRYQCILSPLKYLPKRTASLVFKYIVIAWTISFGLAIIPTTLGHNYTEESLDCRVGMSRNYQICAVLISFYLPLIIMSAMYVHIYFIARSILRKDAQNSLTCDLEHTYHHPLNGVTTNQHRIKHKINWHDWKATITLGVIMLAFIVCWLPFFTLTLWEAIWGKPGPSTLSTVFLWLGYINSMINPVIYTLLNKEFRMDICKQISQQRSRNLVADNDPTGLP